MYDGRGARHVKRDIGSHRLGSNARRDDYGFRAHEQHSDIWNVLVAEQPASGSGYGGRTGSFDPSALHSRYDSVDAWFSDGHN